MIPEWNAIGLLPPIRPDQPGHSEDRSPYKVSIETLTDYFSYSEKRIEILEGFLAYRKELYSVGVVNGFQWLDGSFVEKVENIEDRDPRDIDVVTFYDLPEGQTQVSLLKQKAELFDHDGIKEKYLVDSYYQTLGNELSNYHVDQISYWYSMWSHRRNGIWKGFIQVDLSPELDKDAGKLLNRRKLEGAWA